MKLHQINAAYVAAEDRLMLRISTQDNVEYRFWLTRRLIRALGPQLMGRLAKDAGDKQAPQASREAMLAFAHESAVQQTEFTKAYTPAQPAIEMGDGALLVETVQYRRTETGHHMLSLAPRGGQAAQMQLSDQLMHALIKLIAEAVHKSDWGFEWRLPVSVPQAANLN